MSDLIERLRSDVITGLSRQIRVQQTKIEELEDRLQSAVEQEAFLERSIDCLEANLARVQGYLERERKAARESIALLRSEKRK